MFLLKPHFLRCFLIWSIQREIWCVNFVSVVVQLLSRVQLFATPWTVACQIPVLHHLPEFAKTHVH